jgi:hypothetical protein
MRTKSLLALAASAAVLVPAAAAVAQEPAPDTTPPSAVLKISTTLNSIDAMIGSGLTFGVDPSEDVTYTAKATIKVKGRTVVVARSIHERSLSNQSGGFVEATMPDAGAKAEKTLMRIKKGKRTAVTLSVSLKDTAGNRATVTKTVKLRKRS